ncbi:MAG: STAS domain-containing protein [Armatimonadota bacterium]
MQIETQLHETYALVCVTGRLDAAWADHFQEVIRDLIRAGSDDIRVDAEGLEYLSSAGIRALLKVRREVEQVNGSFGVIRASAFVHDTLRLSGMEALLRVYEEPPADVSPDSGRTSQPPVSVVPGVWIETHTLASQQPIQVQAHSGWKPWDTLKPGSSLEIDFSRPVFGIGIGASGRDAQDASTQFGDFAAAGGYVSWLAGDGIDKPDYLEQAEQFSPHLYTIQALTGTGAFTHLLRFRPETKDVVLNISDLYEQVLNATQSDAAAAVAMVEVEGLVGAALAKSPASITETDRPGEFPEVREWLAFCGERLHRRTLAMLIAFVCRNSEHPIAKYLSNTPSKPDIYAHAHAVVLPFSALPQGMLDMDASISTAYQNSDPIALLHLIEDDRPAIGLGQSSFIQGACWCAPIQFQPETKS